MSVNIKSLRLYSKVIKKSPIVAVLIHQTKATILPNATITHKSRPFSLQERIILSKTLLLNRSNQIQQRSSRTKGEAGNPKSTPTSLYLKTLMKIVL